MSKVNVSGGDMEDLIRKAKAVLLLERKGSDKFNMAKEFLRDNASFIESGQQKKKARADESSSDDEGASTSKRKLLRKSRADSDSEDEGKRKFADQEKRRKERTERGGSKRAYGHASDSEDDDREKRESRESRRAYKKGKSHHDSEDDEPRGRESRKSQKRMDVDDDRDDKRNKQRKHEGSEQEKEAGHGIKTGKRKSRYDSASDGETKEKQRKRSAKPVCLDDESGSDSQLDPKSDKRGKGKLVARKNETDDELGQGDSDAEGKSSKKPGESEIALTTSRGEKVFFFRAFETAKLPKRATNHSAGFDLSSAFNNDIPPHTTMAIETGVKIILPPGCYGRVAGRSGLALLHNLIVMGGVVDSDFTGTIAVIIHNLGNQEFTIASGDRVGQIVVERYFDGGADEVMNFSRRTGRNEACFGSTGFGALDFD